MDKICLLFCIAFTFISYATNNNNISTSETLGLIERMNVNKIDLPLENNGATGDNARAYYPNGQSTLSFLFQGGFATSAYVNGQLRASWIAAASLIEEWQPGNWGMDPTDPLARFYIVNSSDGFGSSAYIDWQNAVNLGADFQDIDGNGIYDPNIDKPAICGDLTIWFPINDNTSAAQRTPRLNTPPIGLEVHATIWAWDRNDEFEDAVFFRYRIINATNENKNDVIFSIWTDPDIGDASDDLCACDTTLSLGYVYNEGTDYNYGTNPPAFGVQFLQGAIIPSPGGTAFIVAGNFMGIDTVFDAINLPMTSFLTYPNGHPVLGDPTTADEARNYQIGGLDAQGNPIDPTAWGIGGSASIDPKYFYSGNPITGSGWIDNSGDDKRFLINCGPFDMAIGDTQDIIFAYEVSQGTNALNSVEKLKQRSEFFSEFLPYGRILTIQANKIIASIDSLYNFEAVLSSFSVLDTIQYVEWYLLEKPITSMAMIIPGPNFTSTLQPDMFGTYTIELHAIITSGDTIIESLSVEAVNNHPPTVDFSIIPNQITFGDPLYLDASNSSDPDGDSIHFDWYIPNWLQANTMDSSIIEFYPPHIGSDQVNLTVRDNYFSILSNDNFDISPMENGLTLDTTINIFSSIKNMQIDSDHLYILNHVQHLSIIDLQTYSPLLIDELIGSIKFITDGHFVISVSGFSNVIIGELDFTYNYQQLSIINEAILNGSLADIYLQYPYLFIPIESPKELKVYDISNPQNPNLINSYALPILTKDVTFSDNFAALYTRYPTLGVITLNISNPNNITALDTLSLPILDRNIEYDSGLIFLLNGIYDGNEVTIIDASDPANLHQAAAITIDPILFGSSNNPILDMHADDNFLFVNTIDGIKMFDVSNPSNPIEKSNYHTGLNVSAVAWNSPLLYAGIPGETIYGAGLNILEFDSSFVLNTKNEPISNVPAEFKLYQNYPNPFNPSTTINYELPKTTNVKIQIFDILGQHVSTLLNKKLRQGRYEASWNGLSKTGTQVASGIYFYNLQTSEFQQTKKMLLLR